MVLPVTPPSSNLTSNGPPRHIQTIETDSNLHNPTCSRAESEIPTKNQPVDSDLLEKRAKQNAAGKRCREKKMARVRAVEKNCAMLEKQNFDLGVRVAILEQEKRAWQTKQEDLEKYLQSLRNDLTTFQAAALMKNNNQKGGTN